MLTARRETIDGPPTRPPRCWLPYDDSPRAADVVVLFYFEDRPMSEIAEILGIKESTGWSQLHTRAGTWPGAGGRGVRCHRLTTCWAGLRDADDEWGGELRARGELRSRRRRNR